MKNTKFKLFASLLFVFSLSGCSIIFNPPTSSNTGSSSVDEQVTSMTVSPENLTLGIGDNYTVTAECYPTGSNQKVTWKSSKLNVATVDANTGVISAVAEGTTKIYATSSANPRVTGYCTLTVAKELIRAESVTLTEHELTLNLNSTSYLHATVVPSNATGKYNFKSFDESVCSVTSTGKVTALGYGTTKIRAFAPSDETKYDECSITVQRIAVNSVSLDKTSLTVATGSQTTLTPTVLPDNADNKALTWTSSNSSIASVDQNGVVSAFKAGSATITATSQDVPSIYATCTFTINDVHPTALSLNKTRVSVTVDSSSTITGIFTPEDTSNKILSWESSNPSIATVEKGNGTTATITGVAIGTCTVTATSEDGGLTATADVEVSQLGKTAVTYNYEDLTNRSMYQIDAIPSTGNPKMIVVPVWMSDSSNYISSTNKASVRSDIEKIYFGTNEETGWRSVKTYYEEESFNQLHLSGVVTDWYNCGYSSSSCDGTKTNSIVSSVASWFKSNNPSTYSDYDTNGDGYLDALVLIYAAPDYSTSGSSNTNLWAYCYWLQQAAGTASNPVPNVFFWASYDFMYSKTDTNSGGYGGGDTSHCNLDAHTYIHEMGHIFGLNDYYDYNGGYSASGGFSMQDYNVGGHDPYSKMALNWIEPYVPTESITLKIKPLETDGDVIILSPKFTGSPFDEYIMIELYTPLGLNKFDSSYAYRGGYPQGPSTAGCRVWHVDSRLASYSGGSYTLESTPTISSSKRYTHAFTNSTFVSSDDGRGSPLATTSTDAYAKYRQLQLIRKNYSSDEKCGDYLNANALFKTGDTFDMTTYKNCFVNKGKLNNGQSLGFSVYFSSVSSSGATITITKG